MREPAITSSGVEVETSENLVAGLVSVEVISYEETTAAITPEMAIASFDSPPAHGLVPDIIDYGEIAEFEDIQSVHSELIVSADVPVAVAPTTSPAKSNVNYAHSLEIRVRAA